MVASTSIHWESWRDRDGRFVFVSPSCRELTGYAPDQFLSDPDFLLDVIHPDDQERVRAHMESWRIFAEPTRITYRIVRADGRVIGVVESSRPVFDQEGRFLGRRLSCVPADQ
jgi:PAS domain S-box-containing protein